MEKESLKTYVELMAYAMADVFADMVSRGVINIFQVYPDYIMNLFHTHIFALLELTTDEWTVADLRDLQNWGYEQFGYRFHEVLNRTHEEEEELYSYYYDDDEDY